MASKTVANDNRLAEIGDRLTPKERDLIQIFRNLSRAEQALLQQEFDRMVPLRPRRPSL